MLKVLVLFILFIPYLSGDDKVEVYATKMDTKDNVVKAYGEVIVVYKESHLSAQRAVYDRNSGELELFGNIRATQGSDIKLLGDYAKLNIANKERTFKPFYMSEQTSNVWLSGSKSYAKDDNIEITSGVMSGCNPSNPLWKMEFTSSEYNTNTMWLSLYNARLYIYDIPVFYTPYFGYSLDTTRRTGVLPPIFGYSNNEGFYYEQSLFIAEQNWWDLELKPQIRNQRGSGIYSTFRFVDSKVSKGSLVTGYFKEKENYFLENNLANETHYGFNFNYDNSDFINEWFSAKLKGQSGIYVDINDMNDVEYINLSTSDTTLTSTATQVISRINIFYNNDTDYFGAYFKYYKDLTQESNEKTIQNLPSFQYHSYLSTLLKEHLLYNLDVKTNNYSRSVGKSAIQTDINIPITLQASLFDEYINISYKSYLYAQHTGFKGEEEIPTSDEYNNGLYARNSHSLSVSSQLTRAYDKFTHVVDFGSQYIVGGTETRDGYYEDQKDYCSQNIHKSEDICEFYNISDIEENLNLFFSQYVYSDDGQQIIYHRLSQNISYEDANGGVGELENELEYKITDSINFYNNMFYNYNERDVSKNFNKMSFHGYGFNIALSHMYKNSFLPGATKTNYMTSSLKYDYNKHYSYNFRYDYDLQEDYKKSMEIGFLYKKRCWDFGLRYVENNRPILDQNGVSDSIYDRYIYLTIALKPIMSSDNRSSDFVYRIPDSSEGN
ncbi:LPS-assembly protein LptD [Candidatus Sulfurimonas marisnigri]|uniref:LPS-assembly protein LptD n=1 Tax=Candidatus Sulfurimonas marisnigri TaxID=2740405 RepID=A0A7S7M0Z1_9BACT|nr:LPS-assembly protein LptD [Candidatus Sulfurimonas marisnigri]QOY55029.1 LPS-assembly protein LptD [Candidatus Sulfurimonas marisnigri]